MSESYCPLWIQRAQNVGEAGDCLEGLTLPRDQILFVRSRPRPILIKLLHFQDKLKILRLARGKKDLSFSGSRVFIFLDYSASLTRKRKAFDTVKSKIKEMGLEYSLRYPCTLRVIVDGEEQLFSDHKAAEAAFLTSMNSSMNSSG